MTVKNLPARRTATAVAARQPSTAELLALVPPIRDAIVVDGPSLASVVGIGAGVATIGAVAFAFGLQLT